MTDFTPPPENRQSLVDYTLKDFTDLAIRNALLDTNCHAVATIQSFDPTKQTCTATINYQKSYFVANPDGSYTTEAVDYPLLLDVPVVILTGGDAGLTFPIKIGDTCVILFNDRSLDNWFVSGEVGQLNSSEIHSISDGIALVGLRSMANLLESYDMLRALLFNGTTGVGVSASKVKIYNADSTLGAPLKQILDALYDFVSSCTASATDPILKAAAMVFLGILNGTPSPPVAIPPPDTPIPDIEGLLE